MWLCYISAQSVASLINQLDGSVTYSVNSQYMQFWSTEISVKLDHSTGADESTGLRPTPSHS